MLSRITGVPAPEFRFRKDQHGRPEIATPGSASPVRFSISHTRGLVVGLAAWNRLVGVDAERIRHDDTLLEVADRVCTPEETATLRAFQGTDRHRRFLELWTLKEAYLKARGVGLALPPGGVSFAWEEPAREIRASFAPALEDDEARWRFTLHRISDEHIVASAIERVEGAPNAVCVTGARGWCITRGVSAGSEPSSASS